MNPLVPGEHFYFSPEGLMIFTRKYHLERGYCCGSGCRECPFDYESVPEPRRSQLLAERKTSSNNNEHQG
jgi:hypothetical protein